MKTLPIATCLTALLVLVLAAAPGNAQDATTERPASEVILEGGYIRPSGDLAGDFPGAVRGFGARPGMEAGFRWRTYLTPGLSLSPAFHFENFGAREGTNDDIGDWSVKSSSYRYTLELMIMQSGETGLRPFLAAAWGIYRNRVEGYTRDFLKQFDDSVNTLGFSFRAGFRISAFELSLLYSFNRFHTWRFFDTGWEEVYFWDNMAIRAGWQLPLGN